MQRPLILSVLILCAVSIQAQESVPREDALKASLAAWSSLEKLENAPFIIDADIKAPSVLKAGERGALIIPETKLADAIKKAGREASPLGYLWLKGLSPGIDGKAVPSSKLRTSTIKAGEREMVLPLYLLGIRKTPQDGLELLIFGRDREPLRAIPLKQSPGKQDLPIELSGVKNGNETADLVLNVVGEYQARITVIKSAAE